VEHFIKCFVRDCYGTWLCTQPCELVLPTGRIQVAAGRTLTQGDKFMGIDLVALLEAEYEKSATLLSDSWPSSSP
jgi:hypothetical protein